VSGANYHTINCGVNVFVSIYDEKALKAEPTNNAGHSIPSWMFDADEIAVAPAI
jgi:hypothetical protein